MNQENLGEAELTRTEGSSNKAIELTEDETTDYICQW